jgi:hypothetical protein
MKVHHPSRLHRREEFLHEYAYFSASSRFGGLVAYYAVLDGGNSASGDVKDWHGP